MHRLAPEQIYGSDSIEIVSIDDFYCQNKLNSSPKISFNVQVEAGEKKATAHFVFSGELRDTGWAGLLSLKVGKEAWRRYMLQEQSYSTQAWVQELLANVFANMAAGSLGKNTNAVLGAILQSG